MKKVISAIAIALVLVSCNKPRAFKLIPTGEIVKPYMIDLAFKVGDTVFIAKDMTFDYWHITSEQVDIKAVIIK